VRFIITFFLLPLALISAAEDGVGVLEVGEEKLEYLHSTAANGRFWRFAHSGTAFNYTTILLLKSGCYTAKVVERGKEDKKFHKVDDPNIYEVMSIGWLDAKMKPIGLYRVDGKTVRRKVKLKELNTFFKIDKAGRIHIDTDDEPIDDEACCVQTGLLLMKDGKWVKDSKDRLLVDNKNPEITSIQLLVGKDEAGSLFVTRFIGTPRQGFDAIEALPKLGIELVDLTMISGMSRYRAEGGVDPRDENYLKASHLLIVELVLGQGAKQEK
jgi:hypothetical protein